MKKIGIHEPVFIGNEKKYLLECIRSNWVSNKGKFLNLFEKKIKNLTKSKYVIPVLNGTIGLHISMIVCGVKENDEVIVPSISFISPINAIKYVGADPIFMDVDANCNIDQDKCIDFIKNETFFKNKKTFNKKTKKRIRALVIIHCFGNAANFSKLLPLCKRRNIKIIEDAAESLGTYYKDGKLKLKHTGTLGNTGVISFNGNKIVTSGNGGAILTQNSSLYKKCKYLINQAKDDSVKFKHNSIGFNYSLSNLSAALGTAQLEKIYFFLKKKKKIHEYYKFLFKNNKNFKLIKGPMYSKNNYWLNLLKIENKKIQKKFEKKFYNSKIQLRPVWFPNHLQKPYLNAQKYKISNANIIFKSLVCLPSSVNLEKKNLKQIANYIIKSG